MLRLDLRLAVRLTPAGKERARLAAESGEKSVLGRHLPIHELSVDKNGLLRTYFIGPVCQGGRNQRLGWVEIGISQVRPLAASPSRDPL